jgi:hypothetical protein
MMPEGETSCKIPDLRQKLLAEYSVVFRRADLLPRSSGLDQAFKLRHRGNGIFADAPVLHVKAP